MEDCLRGVFPKRYTVNSPGHNLESQEIETEKGVCVRWGAEWGFLREYPGH